MTGSAGQEKDKTMIRQLSVGAASFALTAVLILTAATQGTSLIG